MTPQTQTVTPQQSLEQERARFAWDCIQKVSSDNRKEYGTLAKRAPADIQVNGLGQTLAFWRAKGFKNGSPQNKAEAQLLEHICNWLLKPERNLGIANAEQHSGNKVLYWIAHTANSDQYRRAASETIAFLLWLKRFAEAEFGSEA